VQSLNPVEIIKTYWRKSAKTQLISAEGTTSVLLKPGSDSSLKEISFTLVKATGYISKLTYLDKEGNSVSVAFTKMKANKTIPAAVWKLNIPRTAQVIDATGN